MHSVVHAQTRPNYCSPLPQYAPQKETHWRDLYRMDGTREYLSHLFIVYTHKHGIYNDDILSIVMSRTYPVFQSLASHISQTANKIRTTNMPQAISIESIIPSAHECTRRL